MRHDENTVAPTNLLLVMKPFGHSQKNNEIEATHLLPFQAMIELLWIKIER